MIVSKSRLILGTARFPSPEILCQAIRAAQVEIVTVSLRRQKAGGGNLFWEMLKETGVKILPNTAGCRSVKEAVSTAQLARELFGTHWIKLEVTGDEETLQPDPFALVEAARELCRQGFEVFPYTTEDPVVAEKLIAAGCRIVMPWGAMIGSGQGLQNVSALKRLRQRFNREFLVIDAGIGKPSDAAYAMELGYDAVLLNTAVAIAKDPVGMAHAFSLAVKAGRQGYEAGLMPQREMAVPSTPVPGTPFWHFERKELR